MSIVTATTWIPRGFASQFPVVYHVDGAELERLSELSRLQLEDAKKELENAQQKNEDEPKKDLNVRSVLSKAEVDDDLKEYDLEHYDDDDDDDEDGSGSSTLANFMNAQSLAYYKNDSEDPYITLTKQDIEEEDRDELQILPTDNLLLAAKVEDEIAHLEVCVYEDAADNLYVHHDIMMPAIPLCMEWLDIPVGRTDSTTIDANSRGNSLAVGTFDPDIEIWDLDVVDSIYPNVVLGQGAEQTITTADTKPSLRSAKIKRSTKANEKFHVDAVLSLALNRQHRNLLASASADTTLKLWDLNVGSTTACASSYNYHTSKACTLDWHATESTILLSGSYDRTVVAADMRVSNPNTGAGFAFPRWQTAADVDTVHWDPHSAYHFYVATDDGMISYYDTRNASTSTKPIWQLQAHDEGVSAFDVNAFVPGYIATGSVDSSVKLWNVEGTAGGPSMIVSRDLGVGKVFSVRFGPDEDVGFRLSAGGSGGQVRIWDTATNGAVRRAFAGRVKGVEGVERVIGIEQEQEEQEQDGESMDED